MTELIEDLKVQRPDAPNFKQLSKYLPSFKNSTTLKTDSDDDNLANDTFYNLDLPGLSIDATHEDGSLPRSILYDHVRLRYVKSKLEDRDSLVMEVKIAYTKGEERSPKRY